jgi:hypothetical protein
MLEGHRSLDGAYYNGDDVTLSQCVFYCYMNNRGVEFARECFGGEDLLNPDHAKGSDCNEPCAAPASTFVWIDQTRP